MGVEDGEDLFGNPAPGSSVSFIDPKCPLALEPFLGVKMRHLVGRSKDKEPQVLKSPAEPVRPAQSGAVFDDG